MKIGIITHYYNSTNYGGNLQAYALCKIIGKIGAEAEQICFMKEHKDLSLVNKIAKIHILDLVTIVINKIGKMLIAKKIKIRSKAILNFNKEKIPHSNKVYSSNNIKESNDLYDIFITGSDQVWHPMAICPEYLLSFVDSDKKRFSYAASISSSEISKELQEILTKNLNCFEGISVREKGALDIIQPLVKKNVHWVLDPTLLLEASDWEEICLPQEYEKYIFCYFLGSEIKIRKLTKQFSNKRNLKIITIPYLTGNYQKCDLFFGDKKVSDASPEKFISLIKNADYVFTDSFHAMVFSLIFQKKFIVFDRDGYKEMSTRIESLSELFNCNEFFCNDDRKKTLEYIENLNEIDYTKPFFKFEKMKEESLSFLKNIVK